MASRRITNTRDWSRFRLAAVGATLGVLLFCLWIRAFYVQIVRGPEFSARSSQQHRTTQEVKGGRGEIYDRHGHLLAKSIQVKSVFARPVEVVNKDATARVLAKALGESADAVRRKLDSHAGFVWLARQVDDSVAAEVAKAALPGIQLTDEEKRFYPQGHLAGQILGAVGIDNQGLAGIELAYEDHLAGGMTKYTVERDAKGRIMYFDSIGNQVEKVNGQNLRLTIDDHIQYEAEDALAKAVTAAKAKDGVCLVVDVATGDILAMANYPFFNPNVARATDSQQWRNRAIQDAYEPGSTIKPLVVAAALQEKIVKPDSMYNCEGGAFRVSTATIKDTHRYNWLSVNKIVRYSSNIGALKIGFDLGAPKLYDYYKRLGFGSTTGSELPGESKGLLRDVSKWSKVDLATASFGQGFSITPAQLAEAFLCLASGGVLKPLRLVAEPRTDRPEPTRLFSTDVSAKVLSMMREVVEMDGTATVARIPGVHVGGKTGTAQKAGPHGKYGDKYLGTFVGVLPAEKPELLVIVMIDEPQTNHYGGVIAAPYVRDVMVRTLAYQGRLPEPKTQVAAADDDADQSEAVGVVQARYKAMSGQAVVPGRMPNLVGLSLRRATEILIKAGSVPVVEGKGAMVVAQKPAPGEPWSNDGSECRLWLSDGQN